MFATATSGFKSPLYIKILPTNKGIVNHCYKKHRYAALKEKYINETTAGTTARSSDSGRDTPAVSLSVRPGLANFNTRFDPSRPHHGYTYLPTGKVRA